MFIIDYDKTTHKVTHRLELIAEAIELIQDAINFVGLENFKSRIESVIMDNAIEEMHNLDGFEEALKNGDLYDFQLEASYDERSSGNIAAGEEVCGILNIKHWDMVCYTGAMVWRWRLQTNFLDDYFHFDGIKFNIVEIGGDE